MKILSIDCSATAASAAVVSDGKVLSSAYTNVGLTHSQTLMPLINSTLQNAKIELDAIDYFAINAGPGSFTGVRIGIAALKGLAAFTEDNCLCTSTLESMAYNLSGLGDAVICSAMDARCGQVYTACFEVSDGEVRRLTEDTAIQISELENVLKTFKNEIFFVGDGAALCYNSLKDKIKGCRTAPAHLLFQNAVSVAFCAEAALKHGQKPVSAKDILPVYLRAPQAERELKKKQNLGGL